MERQPLYYQRSLDNRVVPTMCAWCPPKLPEDTSSLLCDLHRDEMFIEVLQKRMERYEIGQVRSSLVLLTVQSYLDKIRDTHGRSD